MMFTKILIANRGEIAVRIIRACRELNIQSVAVYSEADRKAYHVRMADEAVCIGPAPSTDSYLSIHKIVEAALRTHAEAIHPGYGFLSENGALPLAARKAGLAFIGPTPEAISAMGDKATARALMQAAGVPVVPGYQGEDSLAHLQEAAEAIGYPVLLKAAAGGGGKGMRVVTRAGDLQESIEAARREAQHAFGSSRLIVERYIPQARHVEFQVLADQYGNIVHLFERECSVQRRHQKIIEESPSPVLDAALRGKMGAAAVQAARAVHYQNAGTVEFILDPAQQVYYFLEMNTRLQVEHPITEAVVGLDLVQWQIRLAAGETLPFTQGDLSQRGHAIECRIYAEDPASGFLPSAGKVLRFIEPKGPGIRLDVGITNGDEVTLHYDPLIAKLSVHAEDRPAALRKMQAALRDTVILGIQTNWQFLQDILSQADFRSGQVHTTWISERYDTWRPPHCVLPPEVLVAAALTHYAAASSSSAEHSQRSPQAASARQDPFSPWNNPNSFRIAEEFEQ
jgi:acetyl-CoA carboxylase biotin carboxylase subunit